MAFGAPPSCHGNRLQGDKGGCWVLFPSGPGDADFQTTETELLCTYLGCFCILTQVELKLPTLPTGPCLPA